MSSDDTTLPPPPSEPQTGVVTGLDSDVTLADDAPVVTTAEAPTGNATSTVDTLAGLPTGVGSNQPEGAAAPSDSGDTEDEEGATPQKRMHHFTMRFPITADKKSPRQEMIDLPSDLGSHLTEIIRHLPNVDLADSSKGQYWAQTVRGGRAVATAADAFESILADENNHFVQAVDVNGKSLHPQVLSMKNTSGALTGERAVLRFMTSMNLGGVFDVPLWDTGIWIRFKPPSDTAIADLMEQLAQDKIKLGRSTYGLVFSNSTVFVNQRLIQFALNHIYDMTLDLEQSEYSQLGDIISVLDIPNLILGVLGALYSSGFRFERACTANPAKCQHVEEETLDLSKIQWPNDRKLTEFQKNFMAMRRSRGRKVAELAEYRNQIVGRNGREVELTSSSGEVLKVELRIPTINQYLDGGQTWISGIVDGVLDSLGKDATTAAKDEYIKTVAQAAAMNQYCHAVAKLQRGENFTEDDATNRQVLAALSQDAKLVEDLTAEVLKYIEDSTMSIIAIPDYTCSNCEGSQLSDAVKAAQHKDPEYRNLIPVDLIQVFFLLSQRRISLIKAR